MGNLPLKSRAEWVTCHNEGELYWDRARGPVQAQLSNSLNLIMEFHHVAIAS